ncbi:hypothetical protein AUC47_10280 [Microbacterium sp. SZ1]|uniref:hypothetical protein n=1 Tax=Microbacterium sp. SZ1 TaxID=1849736 RepID=UPI000BBCD309|nr:hypothetical protein [Microbacterium sp. SZ1]PCE15904.1 hypothetical protein AUC47_10280 [Microbacterium sp. SZ1]
MTLGDLIQILAVLAAIGASIVALIVSAKDRRNAREIAIEDRAEAARLAAEDRVEAARAAADDRRESLRHAYLLHELETLAKLLVNLNRGGSADKQESKRMGAEALTLIGQLGEERLPKLWNERAGDEEKLRAAYNDPEMPEYKKDALEAQLAVHAILREIRGIVDPDESAVSVDS